MSNMSLRVEFLVTTSITEAIKEAKEKARMFNLAYVIFDFNGIQVSVRQNSDIEASVALFHENKYHKFIIC